MKTLTVLTALGALAVLPMAQAQKGTLVFPTPPPPVREMPPRVVEVPAVPPPAAPPASPARSGEVYNYEQKPVAIEHPVFVTEEQAKAIIDRFKAAYPKLGSPRLLIYVNRELVGEHSSLKLTRRTERTESARNSGTNTGTSIRTTGDNTYVASTKPQPTLADKQTVRDVERLFGRPLRTAGASLADQKVAAQLIADRPIEEFTGTTDTPEARKDREALSKVADAVIEILISSKTTTVPTLSGDHTITVPDIQATAISLKDAKILGQASSSDVTSRFAPPVSGYDVREITEATALELMEDMTQGQ